MEFISETRPAENREKEWVSFEDAMKRVKYEESREAIKIKAAEGIRVRCRTADTF